MKYRSLLKTAAVVATLLSVTRSSAQLNPLIVGTIHPGDSIVIYYDVTINTPCNCSQVGNQGNITGSNFAPLKTDDPDTGVPDDSTILYLNMVALPVTFYEFKAVPGAGVVQLSWSVTSESSMLKYEVERSVNGSDFFKIGEVASQNSVNDITYFFPDQHPLPGTAYYRLKMVEWSGMTKYSFIVRVDMDGRQPIVRIYPNPVVGKRLVLQLSNLSTGKYNFSLYNSLGQPIYTKQINFENGAVNMNIDLPSTIAAGIYYAKFGNAIRAFNQAIVIE